MMIINIKQSKHKQKGVICFRSLLFVIRNYRPSNRFVERRWNLQKISSSLYKTIWRSRDLTLYLNVCLQFWKSFVPRLLQRGTFTLMRMYQLLSLHLSDNQGETSKDPLCYADVTLQEATYDAVVIHLGVSEI